MVRTMNNDDLAEYEIRPSAVMALIYQIRKMFYILVDYTEYEGQFVIIYGSKIT